MTPKIAPASAAEAFITGPPEGGVLVVTELVFVKKWEALGARMRFRRDSKAITANARGLLFATVVLLWKRKTVVHVSAWTDISSVKGLGQSRGHVVSVHWVARHNGVQTRSVIYRPEGTWRDITTGPSTIAGIREVAQ
jgi:hypothetical protein